MTSLDTSTLPIRVAVVADDERVRTSLRHLLTSGGGTVVVGANATVPRLATISPDVGTDVDVVVVDLGPGTAESPLEQLRGLPAGLPTVVLGNDRRSAEVARVGVRRPTTSTPTAAVWGGEPAGELLDWLGVGSRHLVEGDGPGEHVGSLDGLVLLDLPDVDSRETQHRVEAERVLELVDLFVWVTDPQKYADARLHDDHVAALSAHEAVTIVVLNQADRLSADDLARCRTDLTRLMERDGLPGATVLATSARTGAGVDELRQRLANTVASRAAGSVGC